MNILHISETDCGGGASIAALRLVTALNNADIYARFGVCKKQTDSRYVISLKRKKNIFEKIRHKLLSKYERFLFKHFKTTNHIHHSLNLYSRIDVDEINTSNYDVVHLHWINYNTLSIKDVSRITKPIVWTMHDSWPACGAEHHPNILEHDDRYTKEYCSANKPASTIGFDLCKFVFKRKKKYLANMPFHFIAPSVWEAGILKRSALFHNASCTVIPNILDRNVFKPISKECIRASLNIPSTKKIIGFGAASAIDDPYSLKGGQYLINALKRISDPEDYQLIVFGPSHERYLKEFSVEIFFTGYINNQNILAQIYNACDVFVCPSVVESFGYTCLESISCGTPVVAFNTSGVVDIIEHKFNGYLATPYDPNDLYAGILYVLENHEDLSKNAFQKATIDFNPDTSIKKHIQLYSSLVDGQSHP